MRRSVRAVHGRLHSPPSSDPSARVAVLLLLGTLAGGRASAAVDLTGRWGVRVTGFGDVIGCVVDIMQSGGSLHVVGQCSTTGAVELAGTVDPATGRVAVVGHGGPCSTITVDGTAAADGQSIGGTVSCMVGTASLGGLFTASHCGNGILDSGEECDDGNVFDGDCCSSVCRFEASGGACPDDNSPCTTDNCDGRGHCQHPANPAAAGTPCGALCDQCGTSRCDGAGTCLRDSKPDGSPCNDDDACTTGDTCQQGQCVGGPPTACAPCQVCDPQAGCVASRAPGWQLPQAPRTFARACSGRAAAGLWAGTVGRHRAFCCLAFRVEGLPPPFGPVFMSLAGPCIIPHRYHRFLDGSDDNGMFHAVLCPHRRSPRRSCCDLEGTTPSVACSNGITPTPGVLRGTIACPTGTGMFMLSSAPR